ncbi:response regulator transcription factor [Dechloromonas sp. XY25]|uniref:Response regulator transcription factor n=1 Tax=Dechloromonas hankyongensis TaxID=2908002 RepID=A0ABS9K269_9RHOO|nr:response regulator transcription factor [Dechloromonas hankyongensis]MCG2577256.1 response regulator transcription factor [Dechloromonas hankyongensis]
MARLPKNAAQTPLTVILIEDSPVLRQTLGALLDELSAVAVVGEAEDESSALELLQRRQPQLAILDLELKAGSGFGVLRALSRAPDRFGRPRAVVFSSHGNAVVRERCFALGVERFFDKATQFDDLLAYVRQASPCSA